MVLETVLLLHYQVQRGILFQDLGVLLTLFMAGLALGAAAVVMLSRRGTRALSPRSVGAGAVAGLAGLSLAIALLIRTGLVGGLLTTGILMLASGFLVAALFAYASLRRRPDQRSIVSPLYSADLLGGCAGSVLASLLLIPMLGLPASAVLMAALVLLALTLI
jgi:spermidine synthase